MGSMLNWSGKLIVPNALRLDHDEARAVFVQATMEGGRIAKAATRVAQLCLPHFEQEEKGVFPVLALLPYLAQDAVRAEMISVLPMISAFRANHDAFANHHRSILAALDDLLHAAQRERNREIVAFVHYLKVHERMEDEVIYPTVILIGKYLTEKLAH